MTEPLFTPDRRYLVVRGRMWRAASPLLTASERDLWVGVLMHARRAIALARRRHDESALREARDQVDEAKRALGERGPVWWTDGAPDYNRRMAANTPYADWYALTEAGSTANG